MAKIFIAQSTGISNQNIVNGNASVTIPAGAERGILMFNTTDAPVKGTITWGSHPVIVHTDPNDITALPNAQAQAFYSKRLTLEGNAVHFELESGETARYIVNNASATALTPVASNVLYEGHTTSGLQYGNYISLSIYQ